MRWLQPILTGVLGFIGSFAGTMWWTVRKQRRQ